MPSPVSVQVALIQINATVGDLPGNRLGRVAFGRLECRTRRGNREGYQRQEGKSDQHVERRDTD